MLIAIIVRQSVMRCCAKLMGSGQRFSMAATVIHAFHGMAMRHAISAGMRQQRGHCLYGQKHK
jgi:hypothetical protein